MAEKSQGRDRSSAASAAASERRMTAAAAAASAASAVPAPLRYCVHKEIDQSEVIMTVADVGDGRGGPRAEGWRTKEVFEDGLEVGGFPGKKGRGPPASQQRPLVVQVLPPTPTTPASESPDWRKPEVNCATATAETTVTKPARKEEEPERRPSQRAAIPKLTLPLIQLSTEDDDDGDEDAAAEAEVAPAEAEGAPAAAEECPEEVNDKVKGGRARSRRRRRRSLANILFAKGPSAAPGTAAAVTPTIAAPQVTRTVRNWWRLCAWRASQGRFAGFWFQIWSDFCAIFNV